MSQSSLARSVGTSPGYVADVLAGRRSLRPGRWGQWEQALKMDSHERQHFRILAAISHIPADGRTEVLRALDRLDYFEELVREHAEDERETTSVLRRDGGRSRRLPTKDGG